MQKYGFICRSCLSKLPRVGQTTKPAEVTRLRAEALPQGTSRRFVSTAAGPSEGTTTETDTALLDTASRSKPTLTTADDSPQATPAPSPPGSNPPVYRLVWWQRKAPVAKDIHGHKGAERKQQAAKKMHNKGGEARDQAEVLRTTEFQERARRRLADEARRKNSNREQSWRREKTLRFKQEGSPAFPVPPKTTKPAVLIRKVATQGRTSEVLRQQFLESLPQRSTPEPLKPIPTRYFDEYIYKRENLAFWSQFHVNYDAPTAAVDTAAWAPANTLSTKKQENRRKAIQHLKTRTWELRQRAKLEGRETPSLESKMENLRFMQQKSYGWFRQQMQGFEQATWLESMSCFDAWKLDFAELVEETCGKEEEEVSLLTRHKRQHYREHVSKLLALQDERAMHDEWQRYVAKESHDKVREEWPQLVLACLRDFPAKADVLIRATWEDSWRLGESVTPPWVVQDAIWFLIRHPAYVLTGWSSQRIADLLVTLMKTSPRAHIRLRQWDIYQLVSHLPTEEKVERLYRALVEYEHPLHFNTLQHIADRLAVNAVFKPVALKIIEYLVKSKQLDVNSPHIGALVTTLLSFNDQHSTDDLADVLGKPAEYFERVLELGFTPNLFTYSVLICNICRCGSMRDALSVLGVMRGQNIEPDPVLYSYLLHTAKFTVDWDAMTTLLQHAASQGVRDPVVWNEPLHFVYKAFLFEARQRVASTEIVPRRALPVFEYMVKVYGNVFKADMLRKFIPWDIDPLLNGTPQMDHNAGWDTGLRALRLHEEVPSLREDELLDPGYDTISIMLTGFIATFSNPQAAFALYRHFKKLLDAGDADAVGFVQANGTLLYDLVLRNMLVDKSYFGLCFGMVSEMIGRSELAATSSDSGHKEVPLIDPDLTAKTAREEHRESKSSSTPRRAVDYWHPPEFRGYHPVQNFIFCHPPPSVHTWSILLYGLMYHRETDHAERIFRLMPDYGVQPNTVSWNTMLSGYAYQQNVRMTVKTLKRLEASGTEPNELTYTAFSYLDDQNAALKMMEDLSKKRNQRLSAHPARTEMEDTTTTTTTDTTEDGERAEAELEMDKVREEMEAWDRVSEMAASEEETDTAGSEVRAAVLGIRKQMWMDEPELFPEDDAPYGEPTSHGVTRPSRSLLDDPHAKQYPERRWDAFPPPPRIRKVTQKRARRRGSGQEPGRRSELSDVDSMWKSLEKRVAKPPKLARGVRSSF